MKKQFDRYIWIIVCISLITLPGCSAKKEFLDEYEKKWLKDRENPLFLIPECNYPPYSFIDKNGVFKGISADIVALVETELGIQFQFVPCKNLSVILTEAKKGGVDVVTSIKETPARKTFLDFTQPYFSIPCVIVVRKTEEGIYSLEKLEGKNVAVGEGYGVEEFLQNSSVNINLKSSADDLSGLRMLSFGEVDAVVLDLGTASYLTEKYGLTNLRVAGSVDYFYELCLATRKDIPILNDILTKTIHQIPEKQIRDITKKWIHLKPSGVFYMGNFWTGVLIAFLISLIVSVALIVWNRRLNKNIRKRNIELKISEKRWHTATEGCGDGIWEWNLENGNVYYSDNWVQAIGVKRKSVKNSISELETRIHHEDKSRVANQFNKLISGKEDEKILEYRMAKDNDGIIWVRNRIKVAMRNRSGKATLIIGTQLDITQAKNALQRLKESEENYRLLIENQNDLVVKVDVEGRFSFVSQTYCNTFGKSREELIGKTFMPLVHEDDLNSTFEAMKGLYAHPYSCRLEQRAMTKNGWRWFSWVDTAILDKEKKVIEIIGVGRDIHDQKIAELKLKESETIFREFAESIKEGIKIYDIHSNEVLYINRANEEIFEISSEKLYESPEAWMNLLNEEDRKRKEQSLFKVKEGEIVHVEYKITLARKEKWIYERLSPIHDEHGNVYRVACISEDITEQKTFQEKLRLSQFSVDNTLDSVFWFNEEGRFIYVNERAVISLGYSKDELLSMKVFDIDTNFPFEGWSGYWNSIKHKKHLVAESFHKRKDGTTFPVEVIGNFMISDRSEIVCAFARDIAERKKHEEEQRKAREELEKRVAERTVKLSKTVSMLEKEIETRKRIEKQIEASRDYLDKIINTIPDPVFVKNQHSEYVLINNAFSELIGVEKEKLVGQTTHQIYKKEEATKYEERDKQVFRTGKDTISEEFFTNKKGIGHIMLTRKALYVNEDKERYVVGTISDITELKSIEKKIERYAEDLKNTNTELEAFSYSVSHDLRAPLRAISGFSKILVEDYGKTLDEEATRLLHFIINNVERMKQLINDLLAFSKAGQKELRFTKVHMQKLVTEVLDEFQDELKNREVHFHIGDLYPVNGDKSLLKQMLFNLISNAVKYTRTKEEAIIQIESVSKEKYIEYIITDNGVGFDNQYADKVFGVFQRLHSEDEFEGTGVGLALVQRIVHRHHGKIWAEGKLNEGARFYVTLPINIENV